jgi:hypothetical protein
VAKIISKRFQHEQELLEDGVTRIAGVDEAAGLAAFLSNSVPNFCSQFSGQPVDWQL